MDGTAEEHLRIGALEDAGDAGAPLELLLDDRPDGLMSSLGRQFLGAWESPQVKDVFSIHRTDVVFFVFGRRSL